LNRYFPLNLIHTIEGKGGMPIQASDNELLLNVPWRLEPGSWIEIGYIRIERSSNGDLKACDSYGCSEARIPPERMVYAAPIPAVYRVLAATPYIYVEFEREVYIDDGEDYWILAPYEVEVYAGDIAVTRLSPVRVKFTLIGDVVEGILARYYKSMAAYVQEELPDPTGTAVVRFIVRGSSVLLPGIGFNALESKFYVDDSGLIYYPLIEVEAGEGSVTAKNTGRPPKDGVREIVSTGPVRRTPIRVLIQQAKSFTMRVEVKKRSLTTQ